MAGLLEDLPQIVLQIAFLIVIEEDDGWAITGAMASLTLSLADSMVKFIFPILIKRWIPHESHLTRVDAMRRRCGCCGQPLPESHSLGQYVEFDGVNEPCGGEVQLTKIQ